MTSYAPITWTHKLGHEKDKAYFKTLMSFLQKERSSGKVIYPPHNQVFAAFANTEYEKIKVVIIGQDPYHGANQANGLAFSVNKGIPFPPSLKNIFSEIESDLGFPIPSHGDLSHWSNQGVLLLNSVLTVESSKANSHQGMGWETFTDEVIQALSASPQPIAFLLWGAYAQKKAAAIDTSRHAIFKSPHPSPLSAHRGFFGCKHFSRANEWLIQQGKSPIDWQIT